MSTPGWCAGKHPNRDLNFRNYGDVFFGLCFTWAVMRFPELNKADKSLKFIQKSGDGHVKSDID